MLTIPCCENSLVKCESNSLNRNGAFLALPPNVHLVKGPASAALYDLRERKVWAVPAVFANALEFCAEGRPLDAALAHAFGKPVAPSVCEAVSRFAQHHPALDLAASPEAKPSPLPVKRAIRPSWLMLEITNACNLCCRHCYVPADFSTADVNSPTLPTSRWMELLAQGRAIGFRSVQLTGGEPTLHPDLSPLLRTAFGLGYRPVALFTNLMRLSDDLLAVLSEILAQVHSSLYSHDAEIHDSITGQKGSFARTLQGLRRVLAAEIETYVSVALLQQNWATRRETISFLNHLGLASDHIKVGCARPQGRGADLSLPVAQSFWPRKLDEWAVEDNTHLVANTCWAGRTAISAKGDVYVCVGERTPLGNVTSAPLKPIVESPAMRRLWQITLDDVPECSQCEFRYGCFDCRADVHLLTGDLWGRDPTCGYNPKTGRWRCEESAMEDRPKRKDDLLVEDMEGDLVVADFRKSEMHVFNSMAAVVWDLCDGHRTVEIITDLLADHFGIPANSVRHDVVRIVSEFRAKDLVE